jgi:hypothetical protein
MQHVTLSVPHDKLPILNNVFNDLGIENKQRNNSQLPQEGIRKEDENNLHAIFKTYFGWEYFRNELEFE